MSKILLIDDDVALRDVVSRALGRQGFEVVEAVDGKDGIARTRDTLPDLVICDLNMPGMDGYEVLSTLRADPRLVDIPFIFLTGQSAPTEMRHGMNLGADDYLTKPVDLGDLLSAVRIRLERRKSQRDRQEKQIARGMELFSGIVHDLRDPLFVMLGYTDLLKSKAGEAQSPPVDSRQILDRMQQAVGRMQTIISETLFLARSRMQRLPFDPGPLDLREFCEHLVADHDENARLRFVCLSEAGCPLVADALRLRQALENLISNALKYSDDLVTLRLSSSPKCYLLEIRDEGIGIPRSEQPAVFEPFFRGTNTGLKPGHGLGLSIVKSCIEQHGGKVAFSSVEGKGTAFFLTLPKEPPAKTGRVLREAAPPAISPTNRDKSSTAEDHQQGMPLRGIIVDDDPFVRELLRDLLDSSLTIVGEAGTLADARLLAQQPKLDVVFLDVNLPDGLGFELLDDLNPNVSVVFVTSDDEYAVNAFDCEAVDFILKPVTRQRLEKALARVRHRRALSTVPVAPAAPLSDAFLLKTLNDKRMVKFADVRRILAYGEYSWVYWSGDKKGALIRKPLKQWLAELPSDRFIRVHRGAIVNLAHLERVEKTADHRLRIHLRDTDEPILVSLRLAPDLNRKLKTLRG